MSERDIKALVAMWQGIGIEPFSEGDCKKTCKDFWLVKGMFASLTLPCDWIEISQDGCSAYLKGNEPGDIASPKR